MAKTLSGGAIISYGPTLPPASQAYDGALFYKTDSTGDPRGLYMFGFVKDINPNALGSQVAQGWVQAVSPDLFVMKSGDTMTGPLTVPAVFKVTQLSGAQRILIGNQDSGGANKPVVLESANGVLTIGLGSNWTNGGTISTLGLGINPAGGVNGLTWQNNAVFHAGKQGAGSGIDSDLLDGQHGAYYLNLGTGTNGVTTNFTGVLGVARGGTGVTSTTAGGVVYGGSATALQTTAAGAAGQVLLSAGASAPTWVNQSTLSVGSATTANTANTATTATTANTANTALAAPWTGLTGTNPTAPAGSTSLITHASYPSAGFTTYVRPSYFYDFGDTGIASATPQQFLNGSISGFASYNTSDIGQYQVGLTVMGSSGNGTRALQLSADWREAAPGLKYRVNDDTTGITAWGAFRTIWDNGNLINLSQLNNDVGYITKGGPTGGGTNEIFWENDQVVTNDYTITTNKNALTAGPITINNGITVTVPNGSTWTIV